VKRGSSVVGGSLEIAELHDHLKPGNASSLRSSRPDTAKTVADRDHEESIIVHCNSAD
jgi:hypothetical protein